MGSPNELSRAVRLGLQEVSASVLEEKYLHGESLDELYLRTSLALALAELQWRTPASARLCIEPSMPLPLRHHTLTRRLALAWYGNEDAERWWSLHGGLLEVVESAVRATLQGESPSDALEADPRVEAGVPRLTNLVAELSEVTERFTEAQRSGYVFGGRISAALGRDLATTAINCFVIPIEEDSMDGIINAQRQAAQTMRKGGGVGYNFSPIRPRGAWVAGTNSMASGAVSFMGMFDATCATVSSAGARRGAQMGILEVSHPDIEEFLAAKREAGRLTNFNISVATVGRFMAAVESGTPWQLVHAARPSPSAHPEAFQREDGLWVYRTVDARALWDQIVRMTYETAEPGVVFLDRMNQVNNLWYTEQIIATNPCSEHPLPAYGCCCLGSINLTRLVIDPFTPKARFDFVELSRLATIGQRMLDNVLDVTRWPLEQQYQEAMAKRRVGQGILGLGTAMMMLGIAYGSDESIRFTDEVCQALASAAYRASAELAEERGSFPLFEADKYLQGDFVQQFELVLRKMIAGGMRNSHSLSIAPTGTISLSFGDSCSNGIEPAFALEYERNILNPDGSKRRVKVVDHGLRVWYALGNPEGSRPPAARTAGELTVDEHLNVLAAAQRWIDAAISKTVNVPADYPFEDFKAIYQKAYALGIKCVSAYRPNPVRGQVLIDPNQSAGTATAPASDPDRRLTLTPVGEVVAGSVRWPDSPEIPGCPSRSWAVSAPEGKFYVTVGTYANGTTQPFQLLVSGDQAPRGLPPLAKLLSGDLRTTDRRWVRDKLNALKRAKGTPFALPLSTQDIVPVSGAIAALATILESECIRTGWFEGLEEQDTPAPLVAAMASRKEPKTGPDGAMAWYADIANTTVGDDGMLVVKEAVLDGVRFPFSVWLAGDFSASYTGLLKCLSLDMRVRDLSWIAARLKSLVDYSEAGGQFWAQLPGTDKGALQPSTVAYIARLVLHRYQVLGLLDGRGQPVRQAGLFVEADQVAVTTTPALIVSGRTCPECQAPALIKRDGCDHCTACGHVGACG